MKYVLDHTGKPYAKLFEDISAIPRGSFKEEKIADFVCNFAKDLGLEYTRDSANNVVVRKPATPGYEDHEVVMLQGHMDMIWNKRPGSTFDFENEGLKLKVTDDGFLMAEETTCGSDDGVAVAYMLAGVAGGLFYKKFYADNIVIPAATAAVCALGKEHLMAVSVRLLGGTFSYFEMFFTYILPCTLATGLFCALTHLLMKPTLQRQIRKHYERHAGGGVR